MNWLHSGVQVLAFSGKPYRWAWLLLSAGFLIGAVAGHIAAGLGLEQLTPVLEQWVEASIQQREEQKLVSLFWQAAKPVGLALILSYSALGVVGLPVLMGIRGFLTACTVSAFVRIWGYQGLAAGAVWVCGSDGILLAALLAVSVPGWTVSWALASGQRKNRKEFRQTQIQCAGVCLVGLALTVAYGYLVWYWLTPVLVAG
ncbi:MAG: hypothetical protein LIO45_07815 [Clostridiales bacterium]|nr:hypothetical protein [Clostridiales bacterium]